MENNFDGIILTINGYDLELQQSVINWLILCALFAFGPVRNSRRPMYAKHRAEFCWLRR